MFDTAIIGTGPAGISAALTLKNLNKSFIWFGNAELSSKITSAELVTNYPGLSNVSGIKMKEIFLAQIKEANIEITPKSVTGIYDMGDYYGILCNQDMYEAKTIILATGVEALKPVKGELDLVGQGVSYCATCDGMLYKGKEIAVLCTDKEYEHEIEFLANLAAKVYVMPIYKNYNLSNSNIEIIKAMPLELIKKDNKIEIVYKNNNIIVDGIFMLKSAITPSVLINGIEVDNGHIVVDRHCKTNLRGIFAGGDCTGRPYQYAKAVGEGNICAHSVNEFLALK